VRTAADGSRIAQIEVRCLEGTVNDIEIVPLRVIGEGSKPLRQPIAWGALWRLALFPGKLWLMESGSWQVRMDVSAPRERPS